MQTATKNADSQLTKNAIEAVLAGAKAARREQLAGLRLTQKSADKEDVVTQGDIAAQKNIIDLLPARIPNGEIIGILAEEPHEAAPPQACWRWVIDPIDGTLPYSNGEHFWCVSVALQQKTTDALWISRIGLLYQASPLDSAMELHGNLFAAHERQGATVTNVATGLARTLGRPETLRLEAEFSGASIEQQAIPEFERRGIATGFRRSICSAVAEMLLGGKCAVVQDTGPLEWDIAAAGLIAKEAGVHVMLKPETGMEDCQRYATIFTWDRELFERFQELIEQSSM